MRNQRQQVPGSGAVGPREEETHLRSKLITLQLIKTGWSNGQKTGPELFQYVSENLCRSSSRLNLFIFAFDSQDLTDCHKHSITKASQNNMTNMQAVSSHQQKNTFARTKFKQYNNIGKDLHYNFSFGFWNKPLVWNNCCQIACICTVIARISEWKAICCKPFKSPLYYSLVTLKLSHRLCGHTYQNLLIYTVLKSFINTNDPRLPHHEWEWPTIAWFWPWMKAQKSPHLVCASF